MNKALKAKHLTQTADELRVIHAALDWYDALQAEYQSTTDTGARYKHIAAKLADLEDACHHLKRNA